MSGHFHGTKSRSSLWGTVMLLWGSEQAVTQWDVNHVDVELWVVCV